MLYDDPDPENGFLLLPDMKWDQKDQESLYLLAIARRRGILSMRELTAEHLPLLKNILRGGKVNVGVCVYVCMRMIVQSPAQTPPHPPPRLMWHLFLFNSTPRLQHPKDSGLCHQTLVPGGRVGSGDETNACMHTCTCRCGQLK